MCTVLYIKANAKPADSSRTFRISEKFVEEYKRKNPRDTIVTLDLYQEGIRFLTPEDLDMHRPEPGFGKTHPILKYAYQFLEADKYIFANPLWNLSIPAILKAYIDYICIANITFKYTAEGPVGLCKGKKAVHITTRGGYYSSGKFAEWEMGDHYLKNFLEFLGVTDYTTIPAETLDVVGVDVDAIVSAAMDKATDLAKKF